MYAIVRSGGTQQKVAVGDVIEIDKVTTGVGETVTLPVLLLVDGESVTADADRLSGIAVTAEVVGATKGPKITILKYKNKTGYRKRQGHRQKYTQVRVTDISSGAASAPTAAAVEAPTAAAVEAPAAAAPTAVAVEGPAAVPAAEPTPIATPAEAGAPTPGQ